jgi:hypothetical protein
VLWGAGCPENFTLPRQDGTAQNFTALANFRVGNLSAGQIEMQLGVKLREFRFQLEGTFLNPSQATPLKSLPQFKNLSHHLFRLRVPIGTNGSSVLDINSRFALN